MSLRPDIHISSKLKLKHAKQEFNRVTVIDATNAYMDTTIYSSTFKVNCSDLLHPPLENCAPLP